MSSLLLENPVINVTPSPNSGESASMDISHKGGESKENINFGDTYQKAKKTVEKPARDNQAPREESASSQESTQTSSTHNSLDRDLGSNAVDKTGEVGVDTVGRVETIDDQVNATVTTHPLFAARLLTTENEALNSEQKIGALPHELLRQFHKTPSYGEQPMDKAQLEFLSSSAVLTEDFSQLNFDGIEAFQLVAEQGTEPTDYRPESVGAFFTLQMISPEANKTLNPLAGRFVSKPSDLPLVASPVATITPVQSLGEANLQQLNFGVVTGDSELSASLNDFDIGVELSKPATHAGKTVNTNLLDIKPQINLDTAAVELDELQASSTLTKLHVSASAETALQQNTVNKLPSLDQQNFAVQVKFGQQQWGQQIAERVSWMAFTNIQTAEIMIDPPELGQINVRVVTQNDQAVVNFVSANAQVRDALDQNHGRLKEMLAEQGLNLADVDVSDQSHKQEEGEESPSTTPRDLIAEEENQAMENIVSLAVNTGIDQFV